MNRQTAAQARQGAEMKPLLAGGILQRKCACGQHTFAGVECDECGKKNISVQRATHNAQAATRNSAGVPSILHNVSNSPARSLNTSSSAFFESRFAHDFNQIPVSSNLAVRRSSDRVPVSSGSLQLEPVENETVNGLLDERITISPEFDPNLGEQRPASGRSGTGLTPPPMRTPAYGTCPSATVVERTIDMTPGGLALGYRTGYGIAAIMRVLPGGTNWDATSIVERVTAGSSTCPAGWNLCTGNSEFFVGAPRYSTVLGVLPGQRNRFFDFHTSRWNQSRLHDATQNPAGLNSCQAVCQQEYLCGGNVIGRHTITRTFRKSTDASGREITIVDATKT